MKFFLGVIDDRSGSGTGEELVEIDAFNDRLRSDGHWVLAGGLASPTESTLVDARWETPAIVDGPLVASEEHISSFWIIDAPSRDAALALAVDGSRACNRRVELRSFL